MSSFGHFRCSSGKIHHNLTINFFRVSTAFKALSAINMLLNLSKIFYEVLLSNFLIGQEADWPDLMPAELRADQNQEI